MVYRWPSIALALAVALAASTQHTSEAHSWIDCIDTDRSVVYDNARKWIYGGETSNGVCKGYINNYPGRGDKTINDKMTYKILMNDVTKGAPPCPAFDDVQAYSNGFNRLQVPAGKKFYYGYLDNGHTSKDKAGRGTFYGVYWTGQPETTLDSTTQLTDDKLIDGTLHDFDDGNCGQTYEDGDFSGSILSGRAGNDYPCVGDLAIPAGTKPGVYNLIWFWRFYNDKVNADIITTGGHYGGAAYSSCFQVEVLGSANEVASDATTTPTPEPTTTPPPTVTPATPAPSSASPTPTPTASVGSDAANTHTGYGTEPSQTPATPAPTPTPTAVSQPPVASPTPSSESPASSASDQSNLGAKKNCRVGSPPKHQQQQYLRN